MDRDAIVKMTGKAACWLLLFLACASARAADMWFSPSVKGVTTSNDCGTVSGLAGAPRIRRSYQLSSDAGVELSLSDKVYAGDEILTGPDDRVELVSGRNVLVLVGPDSSLRLFGLRVVERSATSKMSRLDVELVGGGARMQVRLNAANPELVFLRSPTMGVIVERGDCAAAVADSWRLSVLDGEAWCRLGQGGASGAPFSLEAGRELGPGGPRALTAETISEMKARMPFGHEIRRAALPPNPPPDPEAEAP